MAIPGQTRSWTGPPDPGAPWKIRRHKPHFVEWSGRCCVPWRFRCPVSGAIVVPGGSCLVRDGQTNSGHGRLERSRKAPPLHRVSDTEHRTPEEPGLWHPAGSFAPFRGQGPLPLSQDDIGFPDSGSLVSFFAILTSPRRPKSGHPVFIEENLCPPRRARVFFWKAFGLPQAGAFNP